MLYTSGHKIKFTNISENYQVKKAFKGTLSSLHSSVITYVINHYEGTKKYKEQVVKILNIITYAVYAAEPLPIDWSPQNPFVNIPVVEDDAIQEVLGNIYLTVEGIEWDIEPVPQPQTPIKAAEEPVKKSYVVKDNSPAKLFTQVTEAGAIKSATPTQDFSIKLTDPLDLYLQAPEVPQFDVNKPFISGIDGADKLVIYTTLPEIPKRQRDISVTTDINKMSESDLMNLFPNHFIRTRAEAMYDEGIGLDRDEQFGNIIPIEGYSKEQVLKCIIEYPHLYKLARYQSGLQAGTNYPSFYGWIEIEGELVPTMDIWDKLPVSKQIPRQAEYVKEYVVRKYLLDRDIKKSYFKYPLFGDLQPFLTLVMPAEEYIKRGYDPLEIAKQCVKSRVAFKQSRNPVLRRLNKNV